MKILRKTEVLPICVLMGREVEEDGLLCVAGVGVILGVGEGICLSLVWDGGFEVQYFFGSPFYLFFWVALQVIRSV